MRWWEERKHLLVREKSRIDESFPDNDFTFEVRDQHLWLTGTLLGFFEFECCYPPSYPSAPPDIFPKNRSSKWVPKHQYVKEGRFCLDIREKSWSSRLAAADIINSLGVLLVAEGVRLKEKSEKLVVYEEPEPTELDRLTRERRCIFPLDLEFPKESTYGRLNYVYKIKSITYRIVITDIFEGEDKSESSLAKKVWLNDTSSTKHEGLWIRVNKDNFIKLLIVRESQQVLDELRDQKIIPAEFDLTDYFGKRTQWPFLIFNEQYPKMSFLLWCNTEKNNVTRYGIYHFDPNVLTDRIPSKEQYKHLNEKKVTVIGCGTGGSKDADYLVKAGVGKIVLIDDDILKTENISRHSCQLDDLSVEKVYAVLDKLKKINPEIEITPLRKHLDVIDTDTDNIIKDSDLIIVATASNEEFFNEYAFKRGIPVIYSKVYPMGFGGEIIRVIPGVTPCFECSHHYKEVLIQEGMPEARFPEYNTISYDTLADGTQIAIPALAVDSDFISLITVKMVLEVLVGEELENLSESVHIRLWGNEKEWIFNEQFECISIPNDKLKSIRNCIVCHGDEIIENELDQTKDQIDAEYDAILSQMKSTVHEENSG